MDCVLQFIHVLMVSSNIEDRSDWLRQLYLKSSNFKIIWSVWKDCHYRKLADIWSELYWRIQASGITGVVIFVSFVERHKYGSFVVRHHVDADIDVSLVTIVHPPQRQISMELLGVNIELQVMVGELETRQGENDGLHHTVSPSLDEIVAAILLQV